MEGFRPPGRLSDVHLAGWTIVRVAEDLDAAGIDELAGHVEPELTHGAQVAVDLRAAHLDPATGPEAIRGLAATAERMGARLVVVEADEAEREALRAAGIDEVYESLDAALHVTSPTLIEAESPPPPRPLAPASGDAILVATEDYTGSNGRH